MSAPDPPQWARDLDDQLGQFAQTKTARVIGWSAVAAWCGFIAWNLAPYVLG